MPVRIGSGLCSALQEHTNTDRIQWGGFDHFVKEEVGKLET